MVVLKSELKRGKIMLLIWVLSIASMMAMCVLIYPQMGDQMEKTQDMYSNMGAFTKAFGLDKISMSTATGFYGVECGSILSIGGSFFAALLGAGMLSKEENLHTAEFLLTHPISRVRIISEKIIAVILQVILLNIICILISIISFKIIDEKILWDEFLLFHVAQTIMQLEVACICFGISAFIKNNATGIGIGIASIFYFLSILFNISEQTEFLKYITPFAYADAATIMDECSLDTTLITLGVVYSVVFLLIAFYKYSKKDISS